MGIDKLIKIFFPEYCKACGLPGKSICSNCLNQISLASALEDDQFAVFDYRNSLVQNAIKSFKYYTDRCAMELLAEASIPYIKEYLFNLFQNYHSLELFFVPIPQYKTNAKKRKFNQSFLLSKWWVKYWQDSSSPVLLENVLLKTKETPPQASLKRSARLKNLIQSMMVNQKLDSNKIYILVDDVVTTGATFAEAKRALKKAGGKRIICLALAHGYSKN